MPFKATTEKPEDSIKVSEKRYAVGRRFGMIFNSEDRAKFACQMLQEIFDWATPEHDVIIRESPFIEHHNIDGVDYWKVLARFQFCEPSVLGTGKIINVGWPEPWARFKERCGGYR